MDLASIYKLKITSKRNYTKNVRRRVTLLQRAVSQGQHAAPAVQSLLSCSPHSSRFHVPPKHRARWDPAAPAGGAAPLQLRAEHPRPRVHRAALPPAARAPRSAALTASVPLRNIRVQTSSLDQPHPEHKLLRGYCRNVLSAALISVSNLGSSLGYNANVTLKHGKAV